MDADYPPLNIGSMTAELEKGYTEMLAGRGIPAEQAFKKIWAELSKDDER